MTKLDDLRFKISTFNGGDWAPLTFFLFFIIGGVLIWLSKYFEFPTIIIVLLPVFIIVGYGLISWFLPRLELRKDQIGDNLYYLGFLLTLVSLSATLVQYSSNSDDDYIVSNFGVALVATVCGIAGRTLLNQMRKDVVSVEKEVQATLSQASLRLRGEIFATIEKFASLNLHMEQVTRESSLHIAEAHKTLAIGLSESVDELVEPLQDKLESSVSRIEQQSDTITQRIGEATNRLVDEINRQASVVSEATTSYEESLDFSQLKIDTSALRNVEAEIKAYSQHAGDSIREIHKNSLMQIESLNEVIDKLQLNSNSLNDLFADTVNNLNSQIQSFNEGKKSFEEFAVTIAEINDLLNSFNDAKSK